MEKVKKIGLFGGTFDPIHSAHLKIAHEAVCLLDLDKILFVPAAHPPHKCIRGGASYEHRYRMVELACAGEERFLPSRMEEGEGKSYTILTIDRLRSDLNPADRILFLIGADAFAEIESWMRWEDVVAAVEFIAVTRPGHTYRAPEGARVHRLDTVATAVSSSSIRHKLASGKDVPELPVAVLDYIRRHRLYRDSESNRSCCCHHSG